MAPRPAAVRGKLPPAPKALPPLVDYCWGCGEWAELDRTLIACKSCAVKWSAGIRNGYGRSYTAMPDGTVTDVDGTVLVPSRASLGRAA
jgi:hypothetical protein